MKSYICNAFSLQMVADTATIKKISAGIEEVPANAVSCIGHADTAAVISSLIHRDVPMNRTQVHLEPGDTAWVFQVVGGRLPEGATTLPEGFSMKLYRVTVE